MTPGIPTSTRATTMDATNHSRLTTSCHPTSLRSRTFDSSATSSDHWELTATIRERHGKARGERHVGKPIGWECNDHIASNNTVRTQLNGSSGPFGQELRLCDISSFSTVRLHRWIGQDETRTQKCAGWFHSHDKTSSLWGQADD